MMLGAGAGLGHDDRCWRGVWMKCWVSLDTMLGAGSGRLGTMLASLSSHPDGD